MAEFPALPLWTDAYLSDTMHLSTIEHGAYLLLLMTMWRNGGWLDNDDRILAKYAKLTTKQWARIRPALECFWTIEGPRIIQKRLSAEMNYVRDSSRRQRLVAEGKWPTKELRIEGSDPRSNHAKRASRLAEARKRGRHSPLEWETMRAVFGACVRCGTVDCETVKDHIVPIYQGGSDSLDNLQPLCRPCNASKGPEAIDHRWRCRPTWLSELSNRLGYNPLEGKDLTPPKRLPNVSPLPTPIREPFSLVQSSTPPEEKEAAGTEQATGAEPIQISSALRSSKLAKAS